MSIEKTLRAEDIKIGIAECMEMGVYLYLKADPRDIMDKLDEQFGSLGWQEVHETKVERENGRDILVHKCTLSVWDDQKQCWISRDGYASDTSNYSGLHRMKAEASDALKLAAIQFGIGRELYSFDNIFAFAKNKKGETLINIRNDGTGRYWSSDEFAVTQIIHDESGKIKSLAIKDVTTSQMVFAEDRRPPVKEKKIGVTPTPTSSKYVSLSEAKAMAHDVAGQVEGKPLGKLTPDELFFVYGMSKKRDVKIAAIAIATSDEAYRQVFVAGGIKI